MERPRVLIKYTTMRPICFISWNLSYIGLVENTFRVLKCTSEVLTLQLYQLIFTYKIVKGRRVKYPRCVDRKSHDNLVKIG